MEFCEAGSLERLYKRVQEKGYRTGEKVLGKIAESVRGSGGGSLPATLHLANPRHCRYWKGSFTFTARRLFIAVRLLASSTRVGRLLY